MTKKVLFVLMPEKFRDEEFSEPYEILKEKGYNITVAGFKAGVATGAGGYHCTVDTTLDAMKQSDFDAYDALIIPGGPGSTTYLWNNKPMQEVIQYFHTKKKVVAAICYAVIALVQSQILAHKTATVYPTDEAKQILKEHDVAFVADGCVTLESDKIITAQGPAFAKDFGHAICQLLEK